MSSFYRQFSKKNQATCFIVLSLFLTQINSITSTPVKDPSNYDDDGGDDDFYFDNYETATDYGDGDYASEGYLCAEDRDPIPRQRLCDGFRDCDDGADENTDICFAYGIARTGAADSEASTAAAPTTTTIDDYDDYGACGADEFRCQLAICIPLESLCDGLSDCFDGEDERDCGTSSDAGNSPAFMEPKIVVKRPSAPVFLSEHVDAARRQGLEGGMRVVHRRPTAAPIYDVIPGEWGETTELGSDVQLERWLESRVASSKPRPTPAPVTSSPIIPAPAASSSATPASVTSSSSAIFVTSSTDGHVDSAGARREKLNGILSKIISNVGELMSESRDQVNFRLRVGNEPRRRRKRGRKPSSRDRKAGRSRDDGHPLDIKLNLRMSM